MDGQQCDPNEFYEDEKLSEFEVAVAVWINIFVCVFLIIFSPLVILMPFISKKMDSVCRKCISMILLSDLIGAMGMLFQWIRYLTIEDDGDNIWLCILACFAINISAQWSILWSLMLLCYIFFLLYGMNVVKKMRVFGCAHFVIWPLGVISGCLAENWKHRFVYMDNYFMINACRSKVNFYLAQNGSACLISQHDFSVIATTGFSYVIFLLLTIALSITIVVKSFKSYKQLQKKINEESFDNLFKGAEQSYAIFKSTFHYAITSFCYIIGTLPYAVCIFQLVSYGPSENKFVTFIEKLVMTTLLSWLAMVNIICYGFLSQTFREELKKIVRSWGKCLSEIFFESEEISQERDMIFYRDTCIRHDVTVSTSTTFQERTFQQ